MCGFRYILVSVAGVLSAMVTLLQKYKLMKVNAWTLNLYIGLLGATVTGTISLATEDITFPTDVDNIIYVTIQVCVSFEFFTGFCIKGFNNSKKNQLPPVGLDLMYVINTGLGVQCLTN